MRSDRLFLQDPEVGTLCSRHVTDVVIRAIQFGGTTLLHRRTAPPNADNRHLHRPHGQQGIRAYAPLNVPDLLHWSILATRNDSRGSRRRVVQQGASSWLGAGIIVVIWCGVDADRPCDGAANPAARGYTQKISAGDYEVNIPVKSRRNR